VHLAYSETACPLKSLLTHLCWTIGGQCFLWLWCRSIIITGWTRCMASLWKPDYLWCWNMIITRCTGCQAAGVSGTTNIWKPGKLWCFLLRASVISFHRHRTLSIIVSTEFQRVMHGSFNVACRLVVVELSSALLSVSFSTLLLSPPYSEGLDTDVCSAVTDGRWYGAAATWCLTLCLFSLWTLLWQAGHDGHHRSGFMLLWQNKRHSLVKHNTKHNKTVFTHTHT